MDRRKEFEKLAAHPWFGKQMRKLRAPARETALKFIDENRELSHSDFVVAVNRMFIGQVKNPQWTLILDLLTAASVVAAENKYAGMTEIDRCKRILEKMRAAGYTDFIEHPENWTAREVKYFLANYEPHYK